MSADCCDSGKLLDVDDTLRRLLAKAQVINDVETVATPDALGRVLAEAQISPLDVPPLDNSGMDGYAFALDDLPADGWLPVEQRQCAGDSLADLIRGTAARIFTGAVVPRGADTAIAQEHCEVVAGRVRLPLDAKRGANIRRRGEDITAGATILAKGARLRPQELGMAATMGIARLPVYRRLRVAVFSTGDELAPLGAPLRSGQIYDSNRYALFGLLHTVGCEVIDLGRVSDDFDETSTVLQQAAQRADLIITSGGVSVGEEDYVKAAVERLGEIDLWRIAIKPGKPLAFGRVGETPFFGLPGNPVASYISFCIFVRPFLLRMQGVNDVAPLRLSVPAQFAWPKAGKRREFVRARLASDANGQQGVTLYPNQGSGVLSSVVWGNGLAIIPEGRTVQPGDIVSFLPFSDLLS
ncbi:MAG: gephyrin-like molybdotransferase Glp [Pseudomonadota bacterium]